MLAVQIKDSDMGRACSTHEGKRTVYRLLWGKHEGKRAFGRRGRGWDYNVIIVKAWKDIMRSLMICTPHTVLFG
jgi:hypothetical protein